MIANYILQSRVKPSASLLDKVEEFLTNFNPYEITMGVQLVLFYDEKSHSYYLLCHLDAEMLASKCDLEATIDASETEETYKLNRDISEDKSAYRAMASDALEGRSFEDIVIEFDTTYLKHKPLKVYGGQHRIKAITEALQRQVNSIHGIRVYFCLSREQKVEIATVNNTSVAVPNDLLDRMQEQLLGSELRDWCQSVGLLNPKEDFADKDSLDAPTVRIARTLIVNFFKGKDADEKAFHQPIVCKSGGQDEAYQSIRNHIDWTEANLNTMGREFARLHFAQKETVSKRQHDRNAESARKALSLVVVAAWSYSAGYFQRDQVALQHLYKLPDSVSGSDDPLNAKALSQARHKGSDADTYRGLGTRNSPTELGRMLEVFFVYASQATKKRITKDLANAAIQSYVAKRATFEANKAIRRV